VLKKAQLDKKTVKVVGCGHSTNDISSTNEYMISLKKMNRTIEVVYVIYSHLILMLTEQNFVIFVSFRSDFFFNFVSIYGKSCMSFCN